MTLNEMIAGQSGIIQEVGADGAIRQRLLELGVLPGTRVELRMCAPLGDPLIVSLRGYELSIRRKDARRITVRRERSHEK